MENLGLIIAIVGSTFAIVGVMCALFLWTRRESNDDRREFGSEIKQLRRDLIDSVRAMEINMKDFHLKLAMQDQEFKIRLCSIEEKFRTK